MGQNGTLGLKQILKCLHLTPIMASRYNLQVNLLNLCIHNTNKVIAIIILSHVLVTLNRGYQEHITAANPINHRDESSPVSDFHQDSSERQLQFNRKQPRLPSSSDPNSETEHQYSRRNFSGGQHKSDNRFNKFADPVYRPSSPNSNFSHTSNERSDSDLLEVGSGNGPLPTHNHKPDKFDDTEDDSDDDDDDDDYKDTVETGSGFVSNLPKMDSFKPNVSRFDSNPIRKQETSGQDAYLPFRPPAVSTTTKRPVETSSNPSEVLDTSSTNSKTIERLTNSYPPKPQSNTNNTQGDISSSNGKSSLVQADFSFVNETRPTAKVVPEVQINKDLDRVIDQVEKSSTISPHQTSKKLPDIQGIPILRPNISKSTDSDYDYEDESEDEDGEDSSNFEDNENIDHENNLKTNQSSNMTQSTSKQNSIHNISISTQNSTAIDKNLNGLDSNGPNFIFTTIGPKLNATVGLSNQMYTTTIIENPQTSIRPMSTTSPSSVKPSTKPIIESHDDDALEADYDGNDDDDYEDGEEDIDDDDDEDDGSERIFESVNRKPTTYATPNASKTPRPGHADTTQAGSHLQANLMPFTTTTRSPYTTIASRLIPTTILATTTTSTTTTTTTSTTTTSTSTTTPMPLSSTSHKVQLNEFRPTQTPSPKAATTSEYPIHHLATNVPIMTVGKPTSTPQVPLYTSTSQPSIPQYPPKYPTTVKTFLPPWHSSTKKPVARPPTINDYNTNMNFEELDLTRQIYDKAVEIYDTTHRTVQSAIEALMSANFELSSSTFEPLISQPFLFMLALGAAVIGLVLTMMLVVYIITYQIQPERQDYYEDDMSIY